MVHLVSSDINFLKLYALQVLHMFKMVWEIQESENLVFVQY